MPNLAGSTVTVSSADPAALVAVKEHVTVPPAASTGRPLRERFGQLREQRGRPRAGATGRAFSLEAVVPTGMALDAWDGDRALELWGTSRPEEHSALEQESGDRLVYGLTTAYSHPTEVFRALSAAHPWWWCTP